MIGVLTEPLRGDLYKKGHENVNEKINGRVESGAPPGYVPRPHVQFLEQAGIRVVPIDYRLGRDELVALFDQLNGLYLPGDSQTAVTDETYKSAFVIAMAYAENEAFEEQAHWPVFLMGNSLSTWIRSKQTSKGVLTDMGAYRHTNSRIDLVEHPDDTFLFNKMSREEKQAMFNTAQFFNMQVSGLRPMDLKYQKALTKHLRPLALFTGHGIDNEDAQFIAIAEGREMPLYAFTYGLELIQFYFEDAGETLDNFQLDHSIIARKHAQTIANLIAAELRMNNHSFEHEDSIYHNLIRQEELASITYGLSNSMHDKLPKGMHEHEVYILH